MIFCKKCKFFLVPTVLISMVSFSACSRVQKELGLGRRSPDEFAVVKRAPLSLPPEYDLLPPDPDRYIKPNSDTRDVSAQAKSVIFGTYGDVSIEDNSAIPEANLLNNIGAGNADPDIRKTLDRETGYVVLGEEKGIAEKILFWQTGEDVSTIDASKEHERLQKNIENGLPINEGEVPTIEKKKGVIDKLF